MDKIQALKNAIEFAKKNPNSEQATQLRRRIEGGMYKTELEQIKSEKIQSEGKKAEQFLSKSTAEQLISKETLKELPDKALKTAKELVIDTPVKIAKSLSGVPLSIATGGEKVIPGTYQAEAKATAEQIIDGEKPLISALKPFAEVPLDVITTTGIGKGLVKTGENIIKETPKFAKEGINIIKNVGDNISTKISNIADKKVEQTVLNAITPNTKNISNKEYSKLLDSGRITPKTKTKGSKYILSEAEKQTALKYKDLITSSDPVKNFNKVSDEISNIDTNVGTFLENNNGIFNSGELKNSLKKSLKDITDIAIDEKTISKSKDKLITNFLNKLEKNDMKSLWRGRKEFDREIESAFSGSPTLQNKLKREFRNSVQDFIANRTPDEIYKTSMKEMSNLFKLENLLKTKAISEKGSSAIKLWIKNNPIKAKIIGIGAPVAITGGVLLD